MRRALQRRRGRRSRRRAALAVLAVALCAWASWRAFRVAVGSPEEALADPWSQSTRVHARDGRLLGERRSAAGLRGVPTHLASVSPRLVAATLASEDRAFHRHDGIDRLALLRAALTDLRHGHIVSGGSTITTQLVKRLDHHGKAHARTVATKLVEMARAQNLEGQLGKAALLEAYLNRIDYGHGFAGPEAAAQGYFGVSAADVSLAQATLLAVLPRAPSALDPYRHLDRARLRQRALLVAMRDRGEITAADLERALGEPLVVKRAAVAALVAPHLVLGAKEGGDVATTLDFDLQRDAEGIARTHAARLRAQGAGGMAVVVVDNASGEVLAEVGSADYFDAANAGAVDVVHRRRQAGSTLKPFLYARAFEKGLSPMAALADVPTDLGGTGAVYAPDNFDGAFAGPVAAREALAGSLNVPAVRLVAELGAREAVRVLRGAGLALKEGAERYGASIALGSAEVSPLELAGAYVTLARGGEHVTLRNRTGAPAALGERAFEPASVALVSDALSDSLARVRGLHARGPFELPFPVALKTGTSTGYRDGWTCGYTRERTVVVWVGNASGAPTSKLTGATGAGPVFFDVMKRAMRDVPSRAPLFDAALTEEAEVCALSGDAPGPDCADHVTRRFAKGHAPASTCRLHRRASPRVAPTGEPPLACNDHGERRIVVLPEPYARFLGERPLGAPGLDPHGLGWFLASQVPGCTTYEGGAAATTELGPRVVLVKPRGGAVFHADEAPAGADAVEVVAATEGLPARTPLDVLVDGQLRASLLPPYRALVPITRGDHALEVRPPRRQAARSGRPGRDQRSLNDRLTPRRWSSSASSTRRARA
ncbi:MAG: Multimodular transpeptidase-transglycosylase [Labilithrix sp.]|nr:Multimodular transpeptidase-transglycosylase [Labilithrix sp.]